MISEQVYASVIVPHFRQVSALRECLSSLVSQDFDKGYEVIVADNGTPGGIDDLVSEFPMVLFVAAEERGAAPARNAAMTVAAGKVFAFTDSDCVPGSDWLREGVTALENGKTVLVAGDVQVTCQNETAPTDVEAFEKVFGFRQKLYVSRKRFSVTANIFTWAWTANQIGPFTNGLSEDVDWCHRARTLGFRLSFHGKSLVSHPARADWSALIKKWERLTEERWQGYTVKGRSFGRDLVWGGTAIATVASIVPHVLVILTSPKLNSLGARIAGVRVLGRIRWWRCRQMIARLQFQGEKGVSLSASAGCGVQGSE